jgi:hypothetical protein
MSISAMSTVGGEWRQTDGSVAALSLEGDEQSEVTTDASFAFSAFVGLVKVGFNLNDN